MPQPRRRSDSSTPQRPLLEVVREPGWAGDPDEVRSWAEDLPQNYLLCRDLQHCWRPWSGGPHPDGGYVRIFRCYVCKTRKHQNLSSTGAVLGSHYEYPEGYLNKGMGRVVGDSRDALRLVSMHRTFNMSEDD